MTSVVEVAALTYEGWVALLTFEGRVASLTFRGWVAVLTFEGWVASLTFRRWVAVLAFEGWVAFGREGVSVIETAEPLTSSDR